MIRRSVLVAFLLVVVACGSGSGGSSPSPSGSPRSLPELKLVVLDAVGGHIAYCDPDLYPAPHDDAFANAKRRFPTIKADRELFDAILKHQGLTAGKDFSPDELIAINENYKQMLAIELEPADSGYVFDLLIQEDPSRADTSRLRGTVSVTGDVEIQDREAAEEPNCPICLAAGTRIATPSGEIPVQDLREGMAVWTTDLAGGRIVTVVLETGHVAVPTGHIVLDLALSDGRTLTVSPGHPTADGRAVGELRPGDRYDGAVVTSAALVPYAGSTWDILPAGPTGTYFANGVLLGSTLGG